MWPEFFAFLLLIGSANCLKILVYSPKLSYSHVKFMGTIADTLQMAGHNVTVLQPILNPSLQWPGSLHAKIIQVEQDVNTKDALVRMKENDIWKDVFAADEIWKTPEPIAQMHPVFASSCHDMCSKKEIIGTLKKEKFELGITEFFDFCGFPIFYELGIPNIIGTSSYILPEWPAIALGIQPIPRYISKDNGGIIDLLHKRLVNLLLTYRFYNYQSIAVRAAEEAASKYFPPQPSIFEIIQKKVSFVFTNMDPLIEIPHPMPFGVVGLGGSGIANGSELTEEWKQILSRHPRNVLVSFGSVVPMSAVPEEMSKAMMNTFKRFPNVTFIWKTDLLSQSIIEQDNVISRNWLPQSDLLASGKIDLLMTHGGATSCFETLHFGVPSIVVPIFADQPRNGRLVERLGSGLYFSKAHLGSEDILFEFIEKGLYDSNLRECAVANQKLLKYRSISAADIIVKNVELAAQAGPGKFFSTDQDISIVIFLFSCDIHCFLILAVIMVIFTFIVARLIRTSRKDKVE